jgi:hypothetical protein
MRLANGNSIFTVAAWLLAVGCGGSTADKTIVPGEGEEPKKFQIFPPELYSGFDGKNAYKVPIEVFKNEGKVTLTFDDMSLITDIKDTNGDGTQVTVTTAKAGTTMVHATDASGQTVSAMLTIVMYTPELNALGSKRYNDGFDKDNPPCKDCHGAGKGPDHTPSEINADPDMSIINTFLTGKDPEGRPVGEEFQNKLMGKKHMWHVTKDEEMGLVAYLRSLTPVGYAEYDTATAHE